MMKRLLFKAAFLLFLLLGTHVAFADIVYLKNGGQIEGVVTQQSDTEYLIDSYGTEIIFNASEILRIEKSEESNKAIKARQVRKKRQLSITTDLPYTSLFSDTLMAAYKPLAGMLGSVVPNLSSPWRYQVMKWASFFLVMMFVLKFIFHLFKHPVSLLRCFFFLILFFALTYLVNVTAALLGALVGGFGGIAGNIMIILVGAIIINILATVIWFVVYFKIAGGLFKILKRYSFCLLIFLTLSDTLYCFLFWLGFLALPGIFA